MALHRRKNEASYRAALAGSKSTNTPPATHTASVCFPTRHQCLRSRCRTSAREDGPLCNDAQRIPLQYKTSQRIRVIQHEPERIRCPSTAPQTAYTGEQRRIRAVGFIADVSLQLNAKTLSQPVLKKVPVQKTVAALYELQERARWCWITWNWADMGAKNEKQWPLLLVLNYISIPVSGPFWIICGGKTCFPDQNCPKSHGAETIQPVEVHKEEDGGGVFLCPHGSADWAVPETDSRTLPSAQPQGPSQRYAPAFPFLFV